MRLSRLPLVLQWKSTRLFTTYSPRHHENSELIIRDLRGAQRNNAEIAAFSSTQRVKRIPTSGLYASIRKNVDSNDASKQAAEEHRQEPPSNIDTTKQNLTKTSPEEVNGSSLSRIDDDAKASERGATCSNRIIVKDLRGRVSAPRLVDSGKLTKRKKSAVNISTSKSRATKATSHDHTIRAKSFVGYFSQQASEGATAAAMSSQVASAEVSEMDKLDATVQERNDGGASQDAIDAANTAKQAALSSLRKSSNNGLRSRRGFDDHIPKRRGRSDRVRAKEQEARIKTDEFNDTRAFPTDKSDEEVIASTSSVQVAPAKAKELRNDGKLSSRIEVKKGAARGKKKDEKLLMKSLMRKDSVAYSDSVDERKDVESSQNQSQAVDLGDDLQLPFGRVWRDDDVQTEELSRRFFSIDDRQSLIPKIQIQQRESIPVLPLVRKHLKRKEAPLIPPVLPTATPVKDRQMKQYGNYNPDFTPAFSQHPSLFGEEQIRVGFEAPIDAPLSMTETLAPFVERNKRTYVSVVADADQLFFQPLYLRRGAAGAHEACQKMHKAIEEDLKKPIDRERIRVKLLCNLGGLRIHLLKLYNIKAEVFSDFNEAFLHYAPFFDLTHCGTQPQAADIRVKANLNLDAFNPECERIYLGGLGDYGYLKELHLLKDAQDEEAFAKIRLLCMPNRVRESPFHGILRQKEVNWGYDVFIQQDTTNSSLATSKRHSFYN